MKKKIRNTVFILVVLAVWVAVIILFRDAVWTNYDYPGGRRSVTVERTAAPVVQDEADELRLYDVYEEGSGPAPAWYQPGEPMAAEWSAEVKDAFDTEPGADRNEKNEAFLLDVPLDEDFQIYLRGLCEENGVPYTLAVAVIEAESSYMPNVISVSHDFGLMQINVVCHEWLRETLGISDFLDPYENVRAGVYILGQYYAQYGAESGTLIAYNMGQAAAESMFAAGVYETDYSRRVIGIRWRLEHEASR